MRNMRRLEWFWNGFLMSTLLTVFLNLFKLIVNYKLFMTKLEIVFLPQNWSGVKKIWLKQKLKETGGNLNTRWEGWVWYSWIAMVDGKVGWNTDGYTSALLHSDWLYFLWHGIKWFIQWLVLSSLRTTEGNNLCSCMCEVTLLVCNKVWFCLLLRASWDKN